eukprot:16426893-Heterocapsa_arctica.AAC.1
MAMGFSWQNAVKQFTEQSRKERANIGIGSKAVNDSWLYARDYCIRLKKQVTNKWKVHKNNELFQKEYKLEHYHHVTTANG